MRDKGLLESALARPKNLYVYSESVTLNRLAAAYAVGIAKNNAFMDGNKRTGWVTCAVFLALNKAPVNVEQSQFVQMMLGAADGMITEESFTDWLDAEHQKGTRRVKRSGLARSTHS
ncbi:MAG: type II toxin-antitoxin system death-on-curing family toxin [Acidobacteriaceae bacterium]|nr:type II toxin-antitoxin system death-on-curing family toxin [Acidobacteriaceae bacterium]